MAIQSISIGLVDTPLTWKTDWEWGLPLIVLIVLLHVLGLAMTREAVLRIFDRSSRRHPIVLFVIVTGTATFLATCLHAIEAMIWAIAYTVLGAIPTYRIAMLYSLNAMTSYGHTNLALEDRWHLMGAMEALNGWLLFGLTTAFLFGVIDKVRIMEQGFKRGTAQESDEGCILGGFLENDDFSTGRPNIRF